MRQIEKTSPAYSFDLIIGQTERKRLKIKSRKKGIFNVFFRTISNMFIFYENSSHSVTDEVVTTITITVYGEENSVLSKVRPKNFCIASI